MRWVERTPRVDEAIGAIACHLASGVLGGLLAGVHGQLFWWGILPADWVRPGGEMLGGTTIPTLGIELCGLAALAVYGLPAAYGVFKLCDFVIGVRPTAEDEHEGLDRPQHGLEAYPMAGSR